jgi:hypothetical protein
VVTFPINIRNAGAVCCAEGDVLNGGIRAFCIREQSPKPPARWLGGCSLEPAPKLNAIQLS